MNASPVRAGVLEFSVTHRIRCISPVDGRVYVDRPTASEGEIERTLARARVAQKAWRMCLWTNERRLSWAWWTRSR